MTAPKRQHPTLSDVALALATKQRSEKQTKITLSDANAKGHVQVTVDVTDPDPLIASKTAGDLYETLRAKYPLESESPS